MAGMDGFPLPAMEDDMTNSERETQEVEKISAQLVKLLEGLGGEARTALTAFVDVTANLARFVEVPCDALLKAVRMSYHAQPKPVTAPPKATSKPHPKGVGKKAEATK
jgi:hypothetical protein